MHKYPQPGDFGLTIISGYVGRWISFGQWLTGDASRYTHALVVLDNGEVIQAMPKGAEIVPLSPFIGKTVFSNIPLTEQQRFDIVRHARSFDKVGYSFADYLALALAHIGIKPKRLRDYIASSKRLICSQLVDEAYSRAGVHLFNDGRLPQDVTPGDLSNMLIERDWIN